MPAQWIKANSDGMSRGNPGLAACGGIICHSSGAVLGCFCLPLANAIDFFLWAYDCYFDHWACLWEGMAESQDQMWFYA